VNLKSGVEPGGVGPNSVEPGRERDLRLAAPALAVWGSTLWVLHHSAVAGMWLAVPAIAVGALAFRYSSRQLRDVDCDQPSGPLAAQPLASEHHCGWWPDRRLVLLIVAMACIGVVFGSGAAAFRVAARDSSPVVALAAQHSAVEVELAITDDPRAIGVGNSGARNSASPTYLVRAKILTAKLRDTAPTGGHEQIAVTRDDRVVAFARDAAWRGLLPGQRVLATGVLSPATRADLTAATLSLSGAPQRIRPPPWHQRSAGSVRDGLRNASEVVPQPAGGLIPALAVGDTSLLDAQLVEQFRATGMTHLTAVSGANLALVIGAVLLGSRRIGLGVTSCTVLGMMAMIGFVVLARPSPSVLRAAVMAGIGLAALALGRSRAAFPALALAVIGLLCYDPALAVSPGFVLSVFATAGLVLLAPGWSSALQLRGVPRLIADALAVPAAAQLACAPVIAALAGSVSLVAVPANLLASIAVGPITVLGVVCGLASVCVPGLGDQLATCLAWVAGWPARWLVTIAEHGADWRYAQLSWPGGLGGAALLATVVLLGAVAWRYRVCRWSCAALVAGLLLVLVPMQVVHRPWPPQDWVMVACDVGQGDAAAVRVGPASALVIDAGPDPSLAHRCLTRLGISHIALFVLSHPHADHVGGLAGVSRGRRVAAAMAGASHDPAAGYRRFTRWAQRTGVAVLDAEVGSRHVVGAATITVLGPVAPLSGTRSDANNNSVVVTVEVAGVTMLFPGDVENAAQLDLIAASVPEVDVLKVPHHGSSYSEPEFFDAASPRVALVSVGADNDYGHPSSMVLRRLHTGGAHVARTDRQGDLAIVAGRKGLTVAHHGVG